MVEVVPGAAVRWDEATAGEVRKPGEPVRDGGDEVEREAAVGEEVRVQGRIDGEEPAGAGSDRSTARVVRRAEKGEADGAEHDLALVGMQLVVGIPVQAVDARQEGYYCNAEERPKRPIATGGPVAHSTEYGAPHLHGIARITLVGGCLRRGFSNFRRRRKRGTIIGGGGQPKRRRVPSCLRERWFAAAPALAISLLRHALSPAHCDNWAAGALSRTRTCILGHTARREPPGL